MNTSDNEPVVFATTGYNRVGGNDKFKNNNNNNNNNNKNKQPC
jgi:hypothetical protein